MYLNQSPDELPLEDYLIRQQGFSGKQVDELRENQKKGRLMIHLDGYDEWTNKKDKRVFGAKNLGNWVSSPSPHQVIITCRSQYLQGNYSEYFIPRSTLAPSSGYAKDFNKDAFSEWEMTQFDDGGVDLFMRYHVEYEQQGDPSRLVPEYRKKFMSSGIYDMVHTPIILSMALQVLPTLLKQRGTGEILRLDIYREFARYYMEEQQRKSRPSDLHDSFGVMTAAEKYAIALSLAFFAVNETGISYQRPSQYSFELRASENCQWDRFFDPDKRDKELSSIIPLKTQPSNVKEAMTGMQYSFIHKSMQNYFTARGLYESLLDLTKCLNEKLPFFEAKATVREMSDSPLSLLLTSYISGKLVDGTLLLALAVQWEGVQQQRQWEKDHYHRRNTSPWNARVILENNPSDQKVIDFIKDILKEQEREWKATWQKQEDILGMQEDKRIKSKPSLETSKIPIESRETDEVASGGGDRPSEIRCRNVKDSYGVIRIESTGAI